MTHEKQKEIRNSAIRDIRDGMSLIDVARKYNRTRGWCYDIVKENNLEIEGRCSLKYNTYKIIADLFDSNQTIYDIADRYDISASRVDKIYKSCTEVGIPVPTRTPGTKPKVKETKQIEEIRELGSDYFSLEAPSFQEEIQSINRRIRTRKR